MFLLVLFLFLVVFVFFLCRQLVPTVNYGALPRFLKLQLRVCKTVETAEAYFGLLCQTVYGRRAKIGHNSHCKSLCEDFNPVSRTRTSRLEGSILFAADFVRPTRYFLQKEVASAFVATKLKIETMMRLWKFVYLAVVGWTDAQHCPTLGVTALFPGKRPVLLSFDRWKVAVPSPSISKRTLPICKSLRCRFTGLSLKNKLCSPRTHADVRLLHINCMPH